MRCLHAGVKWTASNRSECNGDGPAIPRTARVRVGVLRVLPALPYGKAGLPQEWEVLCFSRAPQLTREPRRPEWSSGRPSHRGPKQLHHLRKPCRVGALSLAASGLRVVVADQASNLIVGHGFALQARRDSVAEAVRPTFTFFGSVTPAERRSRPSNFESLTTSPRCGLSVARMLAGQR